MFKNLIPFLSPSPPDAVKQIRFTYALLYFPHINIVKITKSASYKKIKLIHLKYTDTLTNECLS